MPGSTVVPEQAEVRQAKSQYETMAVRVIAKIRELDEQIKDKAELLKDSLLEDEEYSTAVDKLEDLNEKKKKATDRLMQNEDIAAIAADVKDLRGEKKEMKESLSGYLSEYRRETGKRKITDDRGVQLTIFETNTVKGGKRSE